MLVCVWRSKARKQIANLSLNVWSIHVGCASRELKCRMHNAHEYCLLWLLYHSKMHRFRIITNTDALMHYRNGTTNECLHWTEYNDGELNIMNAMNRFNMQAPRFLHVTASQSHEMPWFMMHSPLQYPKTYFAKNIVDMRIDLQTVLKFRFVCWWYASVQTNPVKY